jgi:hypothetical protein
MKARTTWKKYRYRNIAIESIKIKKDTALDGTSVESKLTRLNATAKTAQETTRPSERRRATAHH